MSEILKEYGPDTPTHEKPRATCGGCPEEKELPYHPPVGPTNQHQIGPGIHGTVHPTGSQHSGK